jgi:hypothetical protein
MVYPKYRDARNVSSGGCRQRQARTLEVTSLSANVFQIPSDSVRGVNNDAEMFRIEARPESKHDKSPQRRGFQCQAPLGFQGQELLSQPRTHAVKHTHVLSGVLLMTRHLSLNLVCDAEVGSFLYCLHGA